MLEIGGTRVFSRKANRHGKMAAAIAASLAGGLIMAFLPAAESGAATLTNVTIGESIISVQTAALKAALQYGYFKQEGLNVTIPVIVGGSPVLVAGLQSGSLNFINSGYSGAALKPDAVGANVISIAATEDGAPAIDFIVSTSIAQKFGLTKSTPWMTVLQDLKGQAIAVQSLNGGAGIYYKALLNQAGLPLSWMTPVTIASETGTDTALAANQVAATVFQFPGNEEITSNKDGVDLFSMNVIPSLKHIVDTSIMTTTTYAAANPSIVKKIAKGIAWGDNLLLDQATRAEALKAEHTCFPAFSNQTLFSQVSIGMVKNAAQPPSLMSESALVAYNTGSLAAPLSATQIKASYSNAYLPKSYVQPVLPPKKYWDFNSAFC